MKQIPLTKGQFAIVDDGDYDELAQYKWYISNSGYAARTPPRPSRKNVFMHRILAKTPDGMYTDHVNCNRLDNRKDNLRHCTRSQNGLNRSKTRANSTGFKGVSSNNGYGFFAQIKRNYKWHYLGSYKTAEEAHRAYIAAAGELAGEFAHA